MDYSKMAVAELRAIAKEKGIVDAGKMKKKELAELLAAIDLKLGKPAADNAQKAEETVKPVADNTQKVEETVKPARGRRPSAGRKNVKQAESGEQHPKPQALQREERQRQQSEPAEQRQQPRQQAESGEQRPQQQETEQKNFVYDSQEYNPEYDSGSVAYGLLEVMNDGYGFIRSDNYMPGDKDIYISPTQIRRFRLRTGDIIKGPIRKKMNANEKFSGLLYIESVNGIKPTELSSRVAFEDMTPIFPNERIHLDYNGAPKSLRIVDLFSPIGKGQRGMIVSPPKAGKTTLLKQIAKRVSIAYPEMNLIVLLIDERPEEVTDIKEAIEGPNAEVIYSTFDMTPEHHKRVSEMVIERAKRLVESHKDVMIFIDSITRLARAYNLTVTASGRTLSGGLDPAALHMPKKFFGAARNMREGGSLTILATALIETGSRMDDVVFEEFKGTGNMELVLSRSLSEKRVFPAIDIDKSGTRRDDLLLDRDERMILDKLHGELRSLKTEDVTENIIRIFERTRNNKEFIAMADKLFDRR